jgi:hypothetical protein
MVKNAKQPTRVIIKPTENIVRGANNNANLIYMSNNNFRDRPYFIRK